MKLVVNIFLCLLCLNGIRKADAQDTRQVSIDSMLGILTKAKLDSNKVKLLNRLTMAYDGIDQSKALMYGEQGYALAQKLKWNKGIFLNLRYIGAIKMDMGRNKEALTDLERLFNMTEAVGEKKEMIASLNSIGAIYQRTSQYTKAADYFFKALKIAEQVRSDTQIAYCESNIAVLFIQQRDFEKARHYAKKAEEQYQRLNEPAYQAKNLEVLGNCYAFDGKYELAKPYYLRALTLYQRLGDHLGLAIVYTQMVDCYTNDPVKRLEYLRKAKSLWDKYAPDNLSSIANTGNFGYTYFDILRNPEMLKVVQDQLGLNKQQMLLDADRYLRKGIELSKEAGITDLVSQLTKAYADFCEYKKDYKGAYDNLKAHVKLQDSVSSQEIKNKIARLESEREIAIRDEKIRSGKLEMKQLWLYGVITVFSLILLSFYFLNRSRIRQLRLKNELQKKAAEEQTKELLHRNKLSESELKAIRAQMNPHFIFNVLNSIESYIVENDSKTASRLVQKFAALSRLILENSTQSLVVAEREWKALKLYAELEMVRFNNQFICSFYVDPAIDLTKLLLPPMLVQPLIENAIHHGMRNSTDGNNTIRIEFEQTETEICFKVEDNGIGIEEAEKAKTFSAIKSKSIGLSSIKERIDIFNMMNEGKPASFEMSKKEEGQGTGTIARLMLPKVFKRRDEDTNL